MNSIWSNRIGSRRREPVAALVTPDGQPHHFTGKSIPGVCQSTQTAYEKAGVWSNSTFSVLHNNSTAFVSWMEDFGTGEAWPQESWDSGFRWLASRAPALKPGMFDTFIRTHFPKTANKWDAVAAAEEEFGKPATPEQLEAIEVAKMEIQRLNAEAVAANNAARELQDVSRILQAARDSRNIAIARLSKLKAEAETLASMTPDFLNAETAAIVHEVQRLEGQIDAVRRKVEAMNKKAELGNSLGNAFSALGL